MSCVLAILDPRPKAALETIAAAEALAASLGVPCLTVAFDAPAAITITHPSLTHYTADGYTGALAELVSIRKPLAVLFPHTYQVRDYAPKLATRFGAGFISDVVGLRVEGGQIVATRQLFQGKLLADLAPTGPIAFLSLQAGAFAAAAAALPTATGDSFTPTLDPQQLRQSPEEPFRESARAVDLSSAPIIVSVGRGIKEQENLALIEKLAAVLGAEIAASRPICDNGWLPMERQVGSSGQTVAPRLYIAIGISGAIQHLVGMKGAKTVVAINKDASAPIFEVAQYGICADLFDVVPALTEAIAKAKG
jgi:electron transfer flavoprotein alpha subunit